MKVKHNKKRNTAFVYEALIREATVSILKGDHEKKEKVISVIKKHFTPSSLLRKDLECYRSLYENQNIDRFHSEKIIREAKIASRLIDPNGLFKAQTELIDDINKEISPSVFGNYVPNYKTLATIAQIFSKNVSPKKKVMLESLVAENMAKDIERKVEVEEVDNLVYKTFIKKFNEKYDEKLLKEQKDLLNYYVSSFSDNALELKIFLNEEIPRLREQLENSLETEELSSDSEMQEKTKEIIGRLASFSREQISESLLLTVLRTQKLVKEINTNGDNS